MLYGWQSPLNVLYFQGNNISDMIKLYIDGEFDILHVLRYYFLSFFSLTMEIAFCMVEEIGPMSSFQEILNEQGTII